MLRYALPGNALPCYAGLCFDMLVFELRYDSRFCTALRLFAPRCFHWACSDMLCSPLICVLGHPYDMLCCAVLCCHVPRCTILHKIMLLIVECCQTVLELLWFASVAEGCIPMIYVSMLSFLALLLFTVFPYDLPSSASAGSVDDCVVLKHDSEYPKCYGGPYHLS